jgi:hypothetical protein
VEKERRAEIDMLPHPQAGYLANRRAFQDGDGGELTGKPAKMQTVHRPAYPAVLGRERGNKEQQIRPFGQSLPAGGAGSNLLREAYSDDGAIASLERVMEEEIRDLGYLTLETWHLKT